MESYNVVIYADGRLLLKQRGVACGLGVDGGAGQR